jgi:ribose 5-phosphate isomerase
MAAARAIEEVEGGMVLGLGRVPTAAFGIEALAARRERLARLFVRGSLWARGQAAERRP